MCAHACSAHACAPCTHVLCLLRAHAAPRHCPHHPWGEIRPDRTWWGGGQGTNPAPQEGLEGGKPRGERTACVTPPLPPARSCCHGNKGSLEHPWVPPAPPAAPAPALRPRQCWGPGCPRGVGVSGGVVAVLGDTPPSPMGAQGFTCSGAAPSTEVLKRGQNPAPGPWLQSGSRGDSNVPAGWHSSPRPWDQAPAQG